MTKRIGALLLSLLLVLTAMPVNTFAATKPAIRKKITLDIGAKKKAKITANGWKIKSVKVAKYSKKGIVKAKISKKAVTFTGKKAGKTN